MKDNKRRIFILLAFMPFMLYVLGATKSLGVSSMFLLCAMLLALVAFGIVSTKRVMNIIGYVALFVQTVVLSIMGYYDYIQWFSTVIGFSLLAYFLFIDRAIRGIKSTKVG